jgi:hypothetical protein
MNFNENLIFYVYDKSNDSGENAIDADSKLEINAELYTNNTDIKLEIKSISMLTFDVKKSLVGEINTEDVISRFNYFSNIMLSLINGKVKTIIEDLKQKLIN